MNEEELNALALEAALVIKDKVNLPVEDISEILKPFLLRAFNSERIHCDT